MQRPNLDPEPQPLKRHELIEWAATIVAIVSLWPAVILKWPGIHWQVIMYVALALMIWVFVRRLTRFHRALRERKRQGGPPERLG